MGRILKLTFLFLFLNICHLKYATGEMWLSRCPSGWDEFEDHCYWFCQNDTDWSASEYVHPNCRRFGGHLVQIDDSKENEWIKNNTKGLSMKDPWIGLYKYGDDWRWVVDFQVPSFFGWHDSQPSGDGNCGQLSDQICYKWNDIQCEQKFNYICESEMSTSHCPSGWDVYDDHCYKFIQKNANWSSAEDNCTKSGGNLVKIDDKEENQWIKNKVEKKSMKNTWIGLYKYDYIWRWVVDFKVPLFFGWPNSQQEPKEGNCGQLDDGLQYDWSNDFCKKEHHFICERSCNDWETFGSCSVTCGTGKQLFFRRCYNTVPGNSEWYRKGVTVKYEDCNLGGCPGKWSCWQAVGHCSTTCGNGTQLMVRECDNPSPTDNGPYCKGENVSSVWCNIRDCPVYKWGFLKEMNLTKSEMVDAMKKELNEMQANLTVDTKNTSTAIRHRTSARDERPSAASVGYIAIVLLSIPFIMTICCDCTRLFQTTGKMRPSKIETEQNVQNNEHDAGSGNGARPVQCQM